MNERDDLLEREIRGFAAVSPPPERPGLRADLLAEFERCFARARRRRLGQWIATAAAAALLLVAALGLALAPSKPRPPTRSGREGLAALSASIERLAAEVALLQRSTPRPPAPEAAGDEPPAEGEDRFLRAFVLLDRDPALLRLASARAFEAIDPAQAARRYHELLDQYGESPAAAVARARLDSLNR